MLLAFLLKFRNIFKVIKLAKNVIQKTITVVGPVGVSATVSVGVVVGVVSVAVVVVVVVGVVVDVVVVDVASVEVAAVSVLAVSPVVVVLEKSLLKMSVGRSVVFGSTKSFVVPGLSGTVV